MKPLLYTKNSIVRVYSGKPGCACGCRGNYSESKSQITRIWNLYIKQTNNGEDQTKVEYCNSQMGDDFNSFCYWDSEDGTKTYTIYFK